MENEISPVYLQIALDIAKRISNNELPEGTKMYGRSVLSSHYGVSPETIRRSLKLLSDMQVVLVHQNSGAVVFSKENANTYVERFNEFAGIQALRKKLKNVLHQHATLGKEIQDLVTNISSISVRNSGILPFKNYEIDITNESPIIGKTIQETHFWQETGATVIAVKRNDQIIISPGPYFRLEEKDTIIFIGDERSVYAVMSFITNSAQ